MNDTMATGAAAMLFAATFLFGGHVRHVLGLIRDPRTIISFGAGMSIAYVFIHLMPELHGVRRAFDASVNMPLRHHGIAIYYLALLGFLVFYGLMALTTRLEGATGSGTGQLAFRLHIGGFATYVWLVGYLLVHHLEETSVSTLHYAIPLAFHFLSVNHSLQIEHGIPYDRVGRYVLAAMPVLGWAVGHLVDLPLPVVALMAAFVSGAIIMNNAIMELPSEKEGHFLPFLVGGAVYGLVLLPLG